MTKKKLSIAYIDVNDVKMYEKNNKAHPQSHIDRIANSIKQFGFSAPIILGKGNTIIAGHGRLEAAKSLGMDKVPCVHRDDLTKEQERKLRLVDNRLSDYDLSPYSQENLRIELEELDDPLLFDLFDDILIEIDEEDDEEEDEREVGEPKEIYVEKGDIFQLGKHRLMCGDSINMEDVEKLMDGSKADMVFTDPPYNINYEGKTKDKMTIENDAMSNDDFKEFCIDFTVTLKAFCDGIFYVWAGVGPESRVMFTVLDELLHNSTTIVRNKSHFTFGRGKYQNKRESCRFGRNKEGSTFSSARNLVNVRDFDRPSKSPLHPTMKPIEVVEKGIKDSSKMTDKVLDIFGGSGSTLIACERLNRQCYMMELDPKYAQVIIKRYHNQTSGNKKIECLNREFDLSPIFEEEKES